MLKALSERTKVVVRNLPPALAADAFQAFLDKHFEGTYNWLAYYQGKVSLKRTVFSRAFINFDTPNAVFNFKAKFDGHVFVSNRGTQYRCSVEYAPFQKVPTANPKKLAMEGTIEKDADYQAFLQSLEEGPKALPTAQAQLEAQEAARAGQQPAPVVTALMAFLQKKYETQPFTGRRGSKPSRRRELPSVSEGKPSTDRAAKGSKGSKHSRAAAAADATSSSAAAAAGAVEKALKGTRAKASSKQKTDAAAADQGAATKGRRQSTSKAVSTTSRGKESKDEKDGNMEVADARPNRGSKHNSRRGAVSVAGETGSKTATTVVAEDDDAKRAAAAALAAASAANAAAAAARKSRIKAGHQVYTPGAGGRLLAAALPKPGSSNAAEPAEVAVAVPGSAADGTGRGKGDKKHAREGRSGVARTSRRGGKSAATAAGPAGGEAESAPAIAAAALERMCVSEGAGSSGRTNSGRGIKGAAGHHQADAGTSQSNTQQQWVPKSSSAG